MKNTPYNSTLLNGSWIPVKQELAGNELPEETLSNQKLIIDDSTYTFIAENIDKGVVKFSDNKIDIYSKEGVNAGKHFTAIYKFDKDRLIICYNLSGGDYPEEFDTKNNAMLFLSTFEREN